ncbi:MAG TPA: TlyA family RNA methyltransferase [Deltaproteobacteria bacterium]|nr:TlyA family RNA methyltransferase [Deltaproteobacteria bacterium]
MTSSKIRLDQMLVEKGWVKSRPRARALVMAGKVLVNDQLMDKPGTKISESDVIGLKGEDIPYVSRGGLKLEAALDSFKIDPTDLICLDVGASTGGFTDCLLQRGAKTVYALDVGYGQLAWKLRQDHKVVVIERTNIRQTNKETIPDPIDLATIDVSFISLRLVIPQVKQFLSADARIIALIKPQFEVGRAQVGKGGVVRDPLMHQSVIDELADFFTKIGYKAGPVVPSPIRGPKGNKEFFILLL